MSATLHSVLRSLRAAKVSPMRLLAHIVSPRA
jgi:hypothetical protein